MPKTTFPVVSFKNKLFGGYVYIVPQHIAAVIENSKANGGNIEVLLTNGVAYTVEGDIKAVIGAIHEITDMKGEPGPSGG